jgi:short-subunit dehydrogenase
MKIFITGISSGIGRALTKELINQGHEVWGLAREQEKLNSLKNDLNSERFVFSVCDVADESQVAAVVNELTEKKFIPDAVILNAGIFPNDLTPNFNKKIFNQIMAVNFNGAINFISAFLEKFINRGAGHFIFINSTTAFRPSARGIAYPASKAALALASRGLDLIYRPQGILFSTIYLGPVATKMWEGKKNILVSTPEKAADFIIKILKNKKKESYFPFISTSIFRLTKFLPDKIFFSLSKFILK